MSVSNHCLLGQELMLSIFVELSLVLILYITIPKKLLLYLLYLINIE